MFFYYSQFDVLISILNMILCSNINKKGKLFMACISKKIAFIVIFLFISILPVNSFAKIESQCIKISLNKIEDSNRTQLNSSDDESINKIIIEKDTLITNLFQCLKKEPNSIIKTTEFSKRIKFLKARMSTNRLLDNTLAVQRDQVELNTNEIRIRLAEFLSFVLQTYSTHKGKEKIIDRIKIELSYLDKLDADVMKDPGSGKIAAELKEKQFEFKMFIETYTDILQFAMEKLSTIITKSWFHFIHLDTSIDTINGLQPMRPINRIMRTIGLSMGHLIVVLILLALILLLYPLFSRICDLSAGIIANKTGASDQVEIFYATIKRPFKILILFFSINIAVTAFFYKTDGAVNAINVTYCIYSILYLYLFFKLIDAVAIIQLEKYDSLNLRDEIINLFIKFAKFIILVTVFALVLKHFGIKMTAILSTLGIGGLAFALAAKDSLSNLFGGITILMDDLFKQGDWIVVHDVEGTVVEVGVRSTTVRTFANALVTVPNSIISNFQVVNWSNRSIGRRIKMNIGVTYESSMQDIKNAVTDIKYMLEKHPDISNPESGKNSSTRRRYSAKLISKNDSEGIKNLQMVYFNKYNDYSMDILIYCFSKTTNWAEWLKIKEDLLYKIHEILTNNNLEFAYPTEVHINTHHTKKDD